MTLACRDEGISVRVQGDPSRAAGPVHSEGMDFEIAAATTDEDFAGAGALGARLVRFHHSLDAARFFLVEGLEEGYKRFLASHAKSEGVVILVARNKIDQQVIGYAYGQLEPRNWNELLDACGKLHDIYVDDSSRRSGVAQALLEALLNRMRALGAPRVVLLTAFANGPAQKLFTRAGFRKTMLEMTCELNQ